MATGQPCSPWVTQDDLCAPCDDLDVDDRFLDMASGLLFQLDGYRYPGVCERTVRPCARPHGRRAMDDAVPAPSGWRWHPSWGSCACSGSCGCAGRRSVELGAFPIVDVAEVVVDGAVVDPALYRVDNRRWLTRLDNPDGTNPGWPTRQDLGQPDTAEGTWSVTFAWGREPPAAGVHAAAVLACELAMACDPALQGQCRLPKTVTSVTREGITMVLSPSDFIDANGKTGIWEVDMFLRADNPGRLRRNSTVWTPGMRRGISQSASGS